MHCAWKRTEHGVDVLRRLWTSVIDLLRRIRFALPSCADGTLQLFAPPLPFLVSQPVISSIRIPFVVRRSLMCISRNHWWYRNQTHILRNKPRSLPASEILRGQAIRPICQFVFTVSKSIEWKTGIPRPRSCFFGNHFPDRCWTSNWQTELVECCSGPYTAQCAFF